MDLGPFSQVLWPYISIKTCQLDGEVVKCFMHYVSTSLATREFEPYRSKKKKKGNMQESQESPPKYGREFDIL
jgi:hypothetical protein